MKPHMAKLGLIFLACLCTRPSQADHHQYKAIFNGRDLTDWDGNPKFWRIKDGAITGQTTKDNPTPGNTFLVWRGGELKDFDLKLKFRIVGGNSGIQYRSHEVDKWVISGYQADFDADNNWAGILYEERGRGILAKRGNRVVIAGDGTKKDVGSTASEDQILKAIKKEKWNDYRIIAVGNHLVQMINGVTTVDVIDNETEKRAMKGLLALQLHTGPPMLVQFKDLQLRSLGSDTKLGELLGSTEKQAAKNVVFVAGKRSHGWDSHEHYAGCLLLAKRLQQAVPEFRVSVYRNGWPTTGIKAFEGTDAVVVYCDGGKGHYLNPHLEEFDQLMDQGVGLVCVHYGVEVPKGDSGNALLEWIGGYFETHYSVNPHWTAKFESLPDHPISRGVKPFEINDEWYFHMRFRETMRGVTPILSAHPPASTMKRADGPHSGNVQVRAALQRKEIQHVAWAAERKGGGRGFGFTGGHNHGNWANDDFRKVVLNAIVWTAHGEVPDDGVVTPSPSRSELDENQDYPKPESGAMQTDPRALEQGLAGLQVADDLQATLFAGEPMLLSPSNIDIDHLGRVWICEVVNYRKHLGKRSEGDRILILEDTDGDAQADEQTVFYQGRDIDSAHGVCVLGTTNGQGQRAIVSAGENVLVFTDLDGDDRADTKEVLFTGISGSQHDHGIHEFMFGPDGKLYFNFGNVAKQIKDKHGKPIVDLSGNTVSVGRQPYQEGMVFRCNLDGSQFETLGWNFRNNWMLTVDSYGTIWQSDNDDDGNRGVRINYVMEFGNYGYKDELTGANWREARTGMAENIPLRHWHLNDPGVVPNMLQTGGGSPTGITVYEGDALPSRFHGQLLHCEPGANVTRAYLIENDGAGYKATIANILEANQDKWFRPSDVKISPDGSLIVADWYDPGVGGHAMGDLDRGRLYRVTAKGKQKRYVMPQFDFATASGAVNALKNPSFSVRHVAWTALHNMGADAEEALVTMLNSDQAIYQARALWLLGKIPGKGGKYIGLAIAHTNPNIRIVGIRLSRQLADINEIDVVKTLVGDPSAQVRRECLLALCNNNSSEVSSLWAELASQHDGRDRWYLEALGISARGRWTQMLDAWLKKAGPKPGQTEAGRDILWRSRADVTPNMLSNIIVHSDGPAKEIARYFRAFDFLTSSNKAVALASIVRQSDVANADELFAATESLLRLPAEIVRNQDKLWTVALATVDAQTHHEQLLALVEHLGIKDRNGRLVKIALQHSKDGLGVRAVRHVLAHEPELLQDQLNTDDMEHVKKVCSLIGHSGHKMAAKLLQDVKDSDRDIETRRYAVRCLAKTREGAIHLVDEADEDRLAPELRDVVGFALSLAPWTDTRRAAAKLFPLPEAKDAAELPPLKDLVASEGDVARGKEVFNSTGTCSKCHVVYDRGISVGPDLSEIGTKLSREAMFESILYPSAGISHNYETYTLALEDGNIVSGVLTNETDDHITICTVDGIARLFQRQSIDQIKKQPVSLMPADLQKTMSKQDLVDVVHYMQTLKKS